MKKKSNWMRKMTRKMKQITKAEAEEFEFESLQEKEESDIVLGQVDIHIRQMFILVYLIGREITSLAKYVLPGYWASRISEKEIGSISWEVIWKIRQMQTLTDLAWTTLRHQYGIYGKNLSIRKDWQLVIEEPAGDIGHICDKYLDEIYNYFRKNLTEKEISH